MSDERDGDGGSGGSSGGASRSRGGIGDSFPGTSASGISPDLNDHVKTLVRELLKEKRGGGGPTTPQESSPGGAKAGMSLFCDANGRLTGGWW